MTKAELLERLRLLEAESVRLCETHQAILGSKTEGAETARRDSEERLRAIFDTAVEGIITINDRGSIDSFNPAAERIFGYGPSEVLGRNVSMLMPSPQREEHDGYLANYLRTGHARIIGIGREVVGQRKDGSTFPMDLSISEVRLAGGRMFTGIVRDITVRKEAEAKLAEMARSLAEKNKELETIVYVASHDLRSPLVNIQGFSQELARACTELKGGLGGPDQHALSEEISRLLDEDVPEAIEYILSSVVKIDNLLAGLLRFSRLGRAALRIERLDINAMLQSIVHSMEFQVQRAAATIALEPVPDCQGDATQIGQVFSNLIDNAIKYLAKGRPGQITVFGRIESGKCIYAVRDNGIGIAREHQHKVFEIFHRLEPDLAEGEGLGLAIAERILERQNGRIWVESTPGQGSCFFVSLPSAEQIMHRQGRETRSGHTDRRG